VSGRPPFTSGRSPLRCRALEIGLLLALAGGALTGCSMVGPDFIRPRVNVPERFSSTGFNSTGVAQTVRVDEWWQSLGDPVLAGLQQAGDGVHLVHRDRDAALARLHLRRPDGSLVSGAAAFTALWQTLPRWAWLGRLLGNRATLPVLEAGYRGFLVLRRAWRQQGSTS